MWGEVPKTVSLKSMPGLLGDTQQRTRGRLGKCAEGGLFRATGLAAGFCYLSACQLDGARVSSFHGYFVLAILVYKISLVFQGYPTPKHG